MVGKVYLGLPTQIFVTCQIHSSSDQVAKQSRSDQEAILYLSSRRSSLVGLKIFTDLYPIISTSTRVISDCKPIWLGKDLAAIKQRSS